MSVLDSRTKYALNIVKTTYGLNILTISLGIKNRDLAFKLRGLDFEIQLNELIKLEIPYEVLRYKGVVPTEFNSLKPFLSTLDTNKIKCKNIRDFAEIQPLLKTFFPTTQINLYYLGTGVAYDNPYIYLNGKLLCNFTPKFESQIDTNKVSVVNDFLVYEYTKDVYLLQSNAQRHITATLMDRLIINLNTGRITCEYRDVIGDKYCEYGFEFDYNRHLWIKKHFKAFTIDGYKVA